MLSQLLIKLFYPFIGNNSSIEQSQMNLDYCTEQSRMNLDYCTEQSRMNLDYCTAKTETKVHMLRKTCRQGRFVI